MTGRMDSRVRGNDGRWVDIENLREGWIPAFAGMTIILLLGEGQVIVPLSPLWGKSNRPPPWESPPGRTRVRSPLHVIPAKAGIQEWRVWRNDRRDGFPLSRE